MKKTIGFVDRRFAGCAWFFALVMVGPACMGLEVLAARQGDAGTASVLGLEPGDRRLSNDDVGIILWGPDTAPTLSVGKSDVWDRRGARPVEPVLTLAQIVEMANVGDSLILNGAGYYTAYGSYDFPCPKPVGQVILELAFIEPGGGLKMDAQPRSIELEAANGAKSLSLRIFVSAVRNLIVLEGKGAGLAKGDVAIRLYRHRDTIVPGGKLNPTVGDATSRTDFEQLPMPRAGQENGLFWIAQDFPNEATFPNGFVALMAASVGGVGVSHETVEGGVGLGTPMRAEKEGRINHGVFKRYTPINEAAGSAATALFERLDGPFHVLVTVATTQDAGDPLLRARQSISEAETIGVAALSREHTDQWEQYEARRHARARSADGAFALDAVWGGLPYRARPMGYYGDVALCSVDSTKFCFQDSSIWHADFHFNELDATPLCIQRQFDVLDSYFRMVLQLLPMAQANARQVYNCSGAMFPLIHYPLKADTVIHSHISWEQSMEITALISRPFWLRFAYTWDLGFLRDMAYPVLREGARFYADFLKPSADGLYHVFPTVSPEHRGITRRLEFNKDTQSSITLIRYHLRAAARAADLLGADPSEAARWRTIADHLPPYPTIETPDGPIFTDVAGAQPMEYNIPVPLSAVFWGDDIGLDSPPDQLELAKRTLAKINVWVPHRGYLRGVRKRLGIYDPADGLSLENFIQSHTGVIRVFPTVPPDFAGEFDNLGAQGGFVVSAKRSTTGVESVTIESLAGNRCALANPWPGQTVRVSDSSTAQETPVQISDAAICFDTARDRTYRIERTPVR